MIPMAAIDMNDLLRDWKSWTRIEQILVTAAAILSVVVVAAGVV
jgi:hypothetical protein